MKMKKERKCIIFMKYLYILFYFIIGHYENGIVMYFIFHNGCDIVLTQV